MNIKAWVIAFDLRLAGRSIRRRWLPAAAAVASLSIGIGFCTAAFAVISAMDIRALPYMRAGRLAVIALRSREQNGGCAECAQPAPALLVSEEIRTSIFAHVASFRRRPGLIETPDGWSRVDSYEVSGDFFNILGVSALLGRALEPSDTAVESNLKVVVGYRFWRRHLAGDAQSVGKTLTLRLDPSGEVRTAVTIVGVMPPVFGMPPAADLWLPLRQDVTGSQAGLFTVAELRPGVGLRAASAAMGTVLARVAIAEPALRNSFVEVEPLRRALNDAVPHARVRFALFGAALVVLVLASMNVVGLFLARIAASQRELATLVALGAWGQRLVRPMLFEALILSMLGCLGGLALAVDGLGVAGSALGLTASSLPIEVGAQSVEFALASGWIVGLAAGGAAILGILHSQMPRDQRSRMSSRPRGAQRWQDALVSLQVAGCLVLAVPAGLLMKELHVIDARSAGFDPDRLIELRLPAGSGISAPRQSPDLRQAHRSERAELAAVAGVRRVAAQGLIVRTYFLDSSIVPVPRSVVSGEVAVDRDYFATLGTAIIGGRPFAESDNRGADPVAIVPRTVAAKLWPASSPIGKYIVATADSGKRERIQIVGVAEDVRLWRDAADNPLLILYRPFDQLPTRNVVFYVRTASENPVVLSNLTRVARTLDRGKGFDVVSATLAENAPIEGERLGSRLLTCCGAFALLLAAVGLFATVSYAVARTTREIGIRIALGATRGHVLSLVTQRGLRFTAVGLAFGAAGAFVTTRVVRSLVAATSATDTFAFAAAAGVVLVVLAAAGLWPALRAVQLDPVIAIRSE